MTGIRVNTARKCHEILWEEGEPIACLEPWGSEHTHHDPGAVGRNLMDGDRLVVRGGVLFLDLDVTETGAK